MANPELQTAIDLLVAGDLKLGDEWTQAHEICQAHEGEQPFDWLHAVVHRIEGDDRNAGYWYNRCGKERHPGSVKEELQVIRTAFA